MPFVRSRKKGLFKALYLSDYRRQFLERNTDKLSEELFAAFLQIDNRLSKLEESKAKTVFFKLVTYWLGIGTRINTNTIDLDIDEATEMLEEMYKMLTRKEGLL